MIEKEIDTSTQTPPNSQNGQPDRALQNTFFDHLSSVLSVVMTLPSKILDDSKKSTFKETATAPIPVDIRHNGQYISIQRDKRAQSILNEIRKYRKKNPIKSNQPLKLIHETFRKVHLMKAGMTYEFSFSQFTQFFLVFRQDFLLMRYVNDQSVIFVCAHQSKGDRCQVKFLVTFVFGTEHVAYICLTKLDDREHNHGLNKDIIVSKNGSDLNSQQPKNPELEEEQQRQQKPQQSGEQNQEFRAPVHEKSQIPTPATSNKLVPITVKRPLFVSVDPNFSNMNVPVPEKSNSEQKNSVQTHSAIPVNIPEDPHFTLDLSNIKDGAEWPTAV
ncbi:unnamed protein product [Ambrosiozyma monospora]|uniref:Unnamed protein product n=1 Tax=Ambrosiozyma monospora TaxID=43982 RepID=A0A9W7DFN0_AMBMO|nr:unnamed protein product [Ambrosiozyma monospora]